MVIAVGITPNTELASASGLEVDELIGGYKVNAELQSNFNNIWVVSGWFDSDYR